jgi:hypothetical protein
MGLKQKRGLGVLLVGLISFCSSSRLCADVVVNSVSTGSSLASDVTTLTFSHTVETGADRLLLVGVAHNLDGAGSSVPQITGITFNLDPMTLVGDVANVPGMGNPEVKSSLFGLKLGAGGAVTANVVVTLDNATGPEYVESNDGDGLQPDAVGEHHGATGGFGRRCDGGH